MRVAVPLTGQKIAPRYGDAKSFLVAVIEDGKVIRADQYEYIAADWSDWIDDLGYLGVKTIICGCFNKPFVQLAQNQGIHVMVGIWGDARRAIQVTTRTNSAPW